MRRLRADHSLGTRQAGRPPSVAEPQAWMGRRCPGPPRTVMLRTVPRVSNSSPLPPTSLAMRPPAWQSGRATPGREARRVAAAVQRCGLTGVARAGVSRASRRIRAGRRRYADSWPRFGARAPGADREGGFTGPPDARGSVEIGYSLLPEWQGQGHGTELTAALVAWAFSHARVHRVLAVTSPILPASIRVLEKNGFQPMCRGRQAGSLVFELRRGVFECRLAACGGT